MKRRATRKDWLPLARTEKVTETVPTGEAFRPEWIDFTRGIRVGNLQPHERITQILKHHLEQTYGTAFVIDRWGRGVYWQWICWLSKANREAKPISNHVNFGCAKLFVSVDRSKQVFECGLQIERGFATGTAAYPGSLLKDDWDWHRLMRQCAKGTELDGEICRLLFHEGFVAELGDWDNNAVFTAKNFKSARQIRNASNKCRLDRWAGFQLYYPMSAGEVRSSAGYELTQAICATFAEVIRVMNMCIQVRIEPVHPLPRFRAL